MRHGSLRAVVGVSALVVLASCRNGADDTPLGDASATEMFDHFEQICLDRFPDDSGVTTYARQHQFVPLPDPAVYLHEDPGFGWSFSTLSGSWVATIEEPPYHACAVRHFVSSTSGLEEATDRFVAGWAQRHSVRLEKGEAADLQAGPTRQRTRAKIYQLGFEDGRPPDSFMWFWAFLPNDLVELRLVRQSPAEWIVKQRLARPATAPPR